MSKLYDVTPTPPDIAFAAYQRASSEHKNCNRCNEWLSLGLSSICPDCDKIVIEKTKAYVKERSDG